ncbi:hypothetical protein PMIN06_010222 [Paraphaeosphaeria minitans]|uniref:Uncharacterized protein n=1 Tax=Paraphaeosphaeria minitans TaxID=565426 RepID=A0A9P6GER9_9PLEO|nr:hypothetical protein PMIN01_08038 [Paraphaeosphaeria minitans]
MSALPITIGLVTDTDLTFDIADAIRRRDTESKLTATDQLEEIVIYIEASKDELRRSKPDHLEEIVIWIDPFLSEELQTTTKSVNGRSEAGFNRQRGWTWIQLDVEIAKS